MALLSAGFTRSCAVAQFSEGQAATAVCVPPCLVGDSTPDAFYRTIRSGDSGEDAYPTGVRGSAAGGCSTRPPGTPAGVAVTRSAADSAPYLVAVPSCCSLPCKGSDHGNATSGGVAAARGGVRLLSATVTTKGAQPVAGSGGSLGGGHLRLQCRGMRTRLTRWLPTIVPIRCYLQGCAWCLSRRWRTPTLWGRW
jgi:hypothetical protein